MTTGVDRPITIIAQTRSYLKECAICKEAYDHPKCLPCIHTFCLKCLQQYGKDNDQGDRMPCPLCRKEFFIPLGGFDEFPNNCFIEQLLDCDRRESNDPAGQDVGLLCELCDASENCSDVRSLATRYCVDCEQNICDPCSKRHGKQTCSKYHKIVPLHEKPSLRYLPSASGRGCFCSQHDGEPLKLYCYECNKVICVRCFTREHKLHNCEDLDDASYKFRDELQNKHSRLSNFTKTLYAELEHLLSSKEEFLTQINTTEQEIEKQYKLLSTRLVTEHHDLEHKLFALKEKRLKEFTIRADEVERQILIIESFKTYSQELVEKGTLCDISRSSKDILQRVKELTSSYEAFKEGNLRVLKVVFRTSNDIGLHSERSALLGHLVYLGTDNNWSGFDDFCRDPLPLDQDDRNNQKTLQDINADRPTFESDGPIFVAKANCQLAQCSDNSVAKLPMWSNPDTNTTASTGAVCLQSELIAVWCHDLSCNGAVRNMAHLMGKLYVILQDSNTIFVYDIKKLYLQRDIQLKGRLAELVDIAACNTSYCLYVSDRFNGCVWKIVDVDQGQFIEKWLSTNDVEYTWTMSVTFDGRVLMLKTNPTTIDIYGPDTCRLQSIALPLEEFQPHHVVEDLLGNFIVSHATEDLGHIGLSKISKWGQIVQSCQILSNGDYVERTTFSRLVVDADDCIYFCDYDKDKIWFFDPTVEQWRPWVVVPYVCDDDDYDDDDNNYSGYQKRICFIQTENSSKLLISADSEIGIYSIHEKH